jgi:site-specific DNA-methyltransferase (cytosine-N4-specific)
MAASTSNAAIPRSQLLLPLLETLDELGGGAHASDVINAVSSRLRIPEAIRDDFKLVDFGTWGFRRRSAWRQKLHWVRLEAVAAGLLEKGAYGYWTITEKGRGSLVKCQPGVILTVYETPAGEVIWADAITAAGHLADNCLQLLFSSPPYPLAGKGRAYGNITPAETVDMLVKCAHQWRRALKDDGSVVLNLRDVWLPKSETGGAERSLYQEKLLIALVEDVKLHFADRCIWRSPSCMGDAWVTVRRVRCAHNFENIFWLSKGPNPKADNRRVLVPAAASTIATYRQKARTGQLPRVCPSGHKNVFVDQIAAVAAGQTIKVIPRNVLDFANSDPRADLHARLDALHLPHHDAVMPPKLAAHFIELLTEPGDLVADNFFGSGVTGYVAEQLGRRFVGSDHCLAHLLASAARWPVEKLLYGPSLV